MRLATPGAGLWTIRVEGRRVLQGPQPFALCITGGVGGPAGAIALDRFQYGLSDTVEIEVIDTNASAPLTAQVIVQHRAVDPERDPDRERTACSAARSRSLRHWSRWVMALVAVSSGDLVTVSYTGASPAVQVVTTARVNVQAPTITNVDASVLGATPGRGLLDHQPGRVIARSLRDVRDAGNRSWTPADTRCSTRCCSPACKPGTTYRYDVESDHARSAS